MIESIICIFFVKIVCVFLLKLIYVFMFVTNFAASFIISFMIRIVLTIIINTYDIIIYFAIKFKTDFMIFTAELTDDFILIFTSVHETEFID